MTNLRIKCGVGGRADNMGGRADNKCGVGGRANIFQLSNSPDGIWRGSRAQKLDGKKFDPK